MAEPSDAPVSIGAKLIESHGFGELFRDGMALIEETAAYLDGIGRVEAKDLSRPASLVYATESMRLTTRLMQIAAWLLLQRAVNEGELPLAEAGDDKRRIRLAAPSADPRSSGAFADLPATLKDLIERSQRLQGRVTHLDAALYAAPAPTANAVIRELARLEKAFQPERK